MEQEIKWFKEFTPYTEPRLNEMRGEYSCPKCNSVNVVFDELQIKDFTKGEKLGGWQELLSKRQIKDKGSLSLPLFIAVTAPALAVKAGGVSLPYSSLSIGKEKGLKICLGCSDCDSLFVHEDLINK